MTDQEKNELILRISRRFRAEGVKPAVEDRRAKDITAEEMMRLYSEKQTPGGIQWTKPTVWESLHEWLVKLRGEHK